jgi:fluoride exporter
VTVLLVALGAAVGAPARYLVDRVVPRHWGTLLVNVLGSLLLGLFAGLDPHPYALLGLGFCGAFTTFSAFAVEAVTGAGARYVALSAGLCLAAAALGLAVS